MILALLWLGETPSRPSGFALNAPSVVVPGTRMALRAWQLTDHGVNAPPTSVELHDRHGRLISTTVMMQSPAEGLEAEIVLPHDVEGVVELVARTNIDGEALSVSYRVSVGNEEALSAYQPARETSPFQRYELGPLDVLDPKAAPSALDPRIEEGACVPELPCWLSVWVGSKPARIRVQPISGVRLSQTEAGPKSGFLRFPVVVGANEARLQVQALDRTGRVVATRDVRLPILPGGIAARSSVDGGRVRIEWGELDGMGPVLVDVYRGNRWTYALSVTPDAPTLQAALEPGVWRFQVRADLFSTNTAGVTHVAIADDRRDALQIAARDVLADAQRDGLDPIAMAATDGQVADDQVEDAMRALFGPRNFGVVSLSGVVSELEPDPGHQETRSSRWIAAVAIMLIGSFVSLLFWRLDAAAQKQAHELLDAFDDGPPHPGISAGPERWLWLFVFLIFALIAMLALSKGWFGP